MGALIAWEQRGSEDLRVQGVGNREQGAGSRDDGWWRAQETELG